MKYGFVFPYGDAPKAVAWVKEAEQAGWDGFFVWEPVWGIEAWVTLGAAAMRTKRIKLGTMISPLPRMRPWKLAGETVTLDHLSKGRTILAVGLGAPDTGFAEFGEETDKKIRAELLDEGLDIVTGLWQGQPFSYAGQHYTIKPTQFQPPPPPAQKPRIPIWVVGAWPREKSMRRVAKYDGLLPMKMNSKGKIVKFTPKDVVKMKAWVEANRTLETPFDIVVEGETKSSRDVTKVREWAEAGVTWWMEAMWGKEDAAVLKRLRQGPPRC